MPHCGWAWSNVFGGSRPHLAGRCSPLHCPNHLVLRVVQEEEEGRRRNNVQSSESPSMRKGRARKHHSHLCQRRPAQPSVGQALSLGQVRHHHQAPVRTSFNKRHSPPQLCPHERRESNPEEFLSLTGGLLQLTTPLPGQIFKPDAHPDCRGKVNCASKGQGEA